MKVVISTVLLLVIGVSYVSSQHCHMREVDFCSAIAMLHFQSNGIPSDDEQVGEWCETIREVNDCIGNYSEKCMSPVQKELLQLIEGDAHERIGVLCTSGSESRIRYLKHGPCLAEAAQSDTFKAITRDMQAAIETLFDVQFKDRMPVLCCGYMRFMKATAENSRSLCGDEAVEMLDFIVKMILSELPNTICQSFDPEGDTCQKILPPSGTQPQGAESKSQVARLMDTLLSSS